MKHAWNVTKIKFYLIICKLFSFKASLLYLSVILSAVIDISDRNILKICVPPLHMSKKLSYPPLTPPSKMPENLPPLAIYEEGG